MSGSVCVFRRRRLPSPGTVFDLRIVAVQKLEAGHRRPVASQEGGGSSRGKAEEGRSTPNRRGEGRPMLRSKERPTGRSQERGRLGNAARPSSCEWAGMPTDAHACRPRPGPARVGRGGLKLPSALCAPPVPNLSPIWRPLSHAQARANWSAVPQSFGSDQCRGVRPSCTPQSMRVCVCVYPYYVYVWECVGVCAGVGVCACVLTHLLRQQSQELTKVLTCLAHERPITADELKLSGSCVVIHGAWKLPMAKLARSTEAQSYMKDAQQLLPQAISAELGAPMGQMGGAYLGRMRPNSSHVVQVMSE